MIREALELILSVSLVGGCSSGGSSAAPCGQAECGPGESCVVTVTDSGPPCPGDGGMCPPPVPDYVCRTTPPSCSGDLTCGCAASLGNEKAGCLCAGVMGNVLSCTCKGE
jgi:hypothetical protein